MRKINVITEKRKKAISVLLEKGYSKSDIEKVFEMASKADFQGVIGCVPDFDWLIIEDNFVRIEEGNFQKGAQKKQVGNSLKTLLDLLQDVKAITNDSLCMEIEAKKVIDRTRPRVTFAIEEFEPRFF